MNDTVSIRGSLLHLTRDILIVIYNKYVASNGHNNTLLLVCKHMNNMLANIRDEIISQSFYCMEKGHVCIKSMLEIMKTTNEPYSRHIINTCVNFRVVIDVYPNYTVGGAYPYVVWARSMLLTLNETVIKYNYQYNAFVHCPKSIWWSLKPLYFIAKYIPELYTALITDLPDLV